ncbi:MAG: alanine dehydrogenase [Pelagibacterales bacterium]|nr:alanine dehydrogenase [Pelagibacterales bacterium]
MLIGIPKEIKDHEYRVGATPAGVRELVNAGHKVIVQKDAGSAIDFSDSQYVAAGAKIVATAADVYEKAEMILKVKEPQKAECKMIRKGQVIFSYLHLAAEPELTKLLIKSGAIAIAFETVSANDGSLPLLAPMSEVAGKLSIQAGAKALEKSQGGRGVLLGGVPGVNRSKVTVLGGGVSGTNAAKVAVGMGADVTILDKSLPRIRYLCDIFGNTANVIYASLENIEKNVVESDLVVGAVLIPGAAAPKLITKQMVKKMKKGSVMVDISIDQGGCFETSKPTSHSNPTYVTDGVVHYCVTNMPGAVARTSTQALENSTLPFTLALANKGYRRALLDDKNLRNGLNVIDGKVTYKAVSEALGHKFVEAEKVL